MIEFMTNFVYTAMLLLWRVALIGFGVAVFFGFCTFMDRLSHKGIKGYIAIFLIVWTILTLAIMALTGTL